MTTREMIAIIESVSLELAIFLVALPGLVVLLRVLHGPTKGVHKPWNYGYAVLVYAACIPGIMSAVLTCYTLFFTGENLLDKSLTVYALPVLTMFVTLMLISKFVMLRQVPGFDRITGLMGLLGITGVVLLMLSRLHFFVGFFGSLSMMITVGVFLFLMLKWGANRIFRGPGEAIEKPPTFGA